MNIDYGEDQLKYIRCEKYSCLEFPPKNSVELYLKYCGKEKCAPGHTFGPAVRQEYLLHYVLEGEGTLSTEECVYHLKKHDVFLIFPGETTVYSASRQCPWTYIWVAFNGIRAHECLEQAGLFRAKRVGRFTKETELSRCIDAILSSHKLTYYNDLIRQSQLLSFLAILIQEYQENPKTNNMKFFSNNSYVKYAMTFIENNYQKQIGIRDICEYVGVTRSHLTRIFKQALHTSPYDYLLEIRINKAASLLKTTEQPIHQIAFMVGYQDTFAFSKSFKKKRGISPKAFRSQFSSLDVSSKNTF